jgi:3-oxoacyl-[acyl-carrier-protein] synthase-3
MKATILGLGEWIPENIRTNGAWPADFGKTHSAREDRVLSDVVPGTTPDLCDVIVARHLADEAGDPFLGSKRRRVADDHMTSYAAETLAAQAALADAGLTGGEVDVVMAYAAVPDHISPPSATRVAHAVGATRAYAPGVHAACASAIVQLELAAALIESGRARFVLLTQSFLMTRVFPLSHPASPNIGDAATAIVVGPSTQAGVLETHAVTAGEYYESVLWRRRGEDKSRWFEAGGPMFLSTHDPTAAQKLIQNTVRLGSQTVRELAQKANARVTDIDVLASVQPRRWVPKSFAEVLGLSESKAPVTFDERAHLGACGIVTNLLEARRTGRLTDGALVALYGQGAGFTRAAALLRWGAR